MGEKGLEKLACSKVVVFGVGGVGSYAVEALARAGIGQMTLVDYDTVCVTNINRQLGALHSTVGRVKVEVLRERIHDINPQAQVTVHREFVSAENVDRLVEEDSSYLVDAIDKVTGKLAIIEKAFSLGIPVISAMGAGNRMDPTKIRIADISETVGCPLARIMRRELRKRGITRGLKVVYSTEPALKVDAGLPDGVRTPGSISFVPGAVGLFLASQIVNDLLKMNIKTDT